MARYVTASHYLFMSIIIMLMPCWDARLHEPWMRYYENSAPIRLFCLEMHSQFLNLALISAWMRRVMMQKTFIILLQQIAVNTLIRRDTQKQQQSRSKSTWLPIASSLRDIRTVVQIVFTFIFRHPCATNFCPAKNDDRVNVDSVKFVFQLGFRFVQAGARLSLHWKLVKILMLVDRCQNVLTR